VSSLKGESEGLRRVRDLILRVAPFPAPVLVLGETGTGKELVARALHDASPRHKGPFVAINCGALPENLVESEIFGHEAGAFTGAQKRHRGKVELADKGTLFLDEVGDLPIELQPKLLRVLQEREFERLGSTKTVSIDVRVISATNRDLAQMVAERRFRDDLFYRLSVFPVTMPTLRERVDDIPLLVEAFVEKYSRRLKKPVSEVPPETMEALRAYSWPGNVRELENFIERAVILTRGKTLEAPLSELRNRPGLLPEGPTLEETERRHIVKTLEATRWVVGGPRGAAAALGLNRTTLQAKMKRLGIKRPT
jgi:formate hydrogenlyase transcriptional activator